MAIKINLHSSLISKIKIADQIQCVEYEGVPNVCFDCGRYGHVKEIVDSLNEEAELSEDDIEAELRERTFTNFEMVVCMKLDWSVLVSGKHCYGLSSIGVK
ncbi:hypothetical protein Goari_018918 [Gossypium aridum]|uniref:CCHC-type domain-containing protein n=1 Tax=Gossypium aridum TaxID=34290 RepID=A0A7J8WS59_GOSAI|nr:hypothetical protein [Gossypium aridum]